MLLIAPQTTEFATKVAVLGALAIVCAARPLLLLARSGRAVDGLRPLGRAVRRARSELAGSPARSCSPALVVLAGLPARPSAAAASAGARRPRSARGHVVDVGGDRPRIDRQAARRIASDLVDDLRIEAEALAERDLDRATAAATGERLAALWERIDAAGRASSSRSTTSTG